MKTSRVLRAGASYGLGTTV